MEIGTVATVTGCVLAVATFFIGRMSASNLAGKEAGSLATDIKYIKESIVRIEQRYDADISRLDSGVDNASLRLQALAQETAQAMQAARRAHTRLDTHLEREHGNPANYQERQ